jgi:curli biogenesis system outer membrane secretion channel CsgG
MKRAHIIFVAVLLVCANLYAADANDVVVREVVGKGSNRDAAIRNALYIAVSQVRGVDVGSGTYEFDFTEAGVDIDSGQAKKKVTFDAVSVAATGTTYATRTTGSVKTYDILEEKQIDENTYQVKLKVTVHDYAPRDDAARMKVAIMPVRAMKDSFPFLDTTVPASVLSTLLTQKIASALTQTNKFAVLDRESIAEFAREKGILILEDAPIAERAKLAEILGADYLLVGSISEGKLEKKQKYLTAADYTVTEYKARFAFNYRLISAFTRQIILAETVEKYLENEQIREIADERNPAEWDAGQIRDGILTLIANDVVGKVIASIYPIRIATIQQDGTVVINQGGDRISEGMLLDVFAEGEEIFDHDTKESLGKIENLVATIRIERVDQKMSFAKVVNGNASKISKGLIFRIKGGEKAEEAGMKPDVTRTKSGGVRLPFDN